MISVHPWMPAEIGKFVLAVVIGENSFLTERRSIEFNGVSVGPEQDWTETSGSWMGSGKFDSVAIAAKILSRKQRMSFDEAVGSSKNID